MRYEVSATDDHFDAIIDANHPIDCFDEIVRRRHPASDDALIAHWDGDLMLVSVRYGDEIEDYEYAINAM